MSRRYSPTTKTNSSGITCLLMKKKPCTIAGLKQSINKEVIHLIKKPAS